MNVTPLASTPIGTLSPIGSIFSHTPNTTSRRSASQKVGVLELNRNPENYFAEVEQSAFTPAHVVPGIGFSPDKFLQGRLFVYGDAQRYRLGINYNQIPVNRPKVEVHDYHRDGLMRTDGNYGGARLFLTTGLCGGFTTFSTFSSDGVGLLKGEFYGAFVLYTLLSIGIGLAATLAGGYVGKQI